MIIPARSYKKIVNAVPILCVDVVVETGGKYLLVKRAKEPLKGRWWVPGGRVLKGETISAAAKRKIREELGIRVKVLGALGYYEKYFKENEFGLEGGIHTVSIVVTVKPITSRIKLDNQSLAWRLAESLPRGLRIKPFGFGGST